MRGSRALAARRGYLALLVPLFAIIATVSSPAAPAEMLEREFDSSSLSAVMRYSLYLPPGYRAQGPTRYPVLYLLHGVGDNHRAWVRGGKVEETADRLVNTGEVAPFIAIIPDATTSWYVDSADVDGPGNYATAIREDLVQHTDSSYPTRAQRHGRAIAGLSMGGFGALRLALQSPDTFVAAAGMSSALWLHVRGDTVLDERQEKIFNGSFGTPFDPHRFMRQGPLAYLENAARYRGTLGILVTAGDDDRFGAYRSATTAYSAIRDAGIDAQLRITDGDHVWPTWAATLPDVLRFFSGYWRADR